ncbi:hypothetical protein OTSUT76_0935 [Orientia tsutsugamushi str. UT76]|uniref:Tetratricopeptide repeat-like domain-containing protein n=1 Tax=Orientia tsutsugamushi TaxID=784 RepID=A0A2U3RCN9_ORITS|nr:DUF2659 family protein [Orientia tsutsugamushi]KJV91186.1 hypothetical protein OTSUT76_0935 [Orientia tsutsugamushi str. UT76]SPR10977.1 Uncharacterised protein [Orientia tsutsugamushi]
MSDILQEIKDSDRYQRCLLYYKKFLLIVFGLSLFITAAMMINNFYNARQEAYYQKITDIFIESIDQDSNNSELIVKSLEKFLLSNYNTKVQELSHIQLLVHKIKAGSFTEVKQLANEILAIKNYSDFTKAYVRLNLLAMAIDVKQNDDNSNYDSQTQLIEQLFSEFSPSMPFWSIASIYYAIWAHENGDDNKAIQYLEAVIKSKYSSWNLKSQAKMLKQNYEINM